MLARGDEFPSMFSGFFYFRKRDGLEAVVYGDGTFEMAGEFKPVGEELGAVMSKVVDEETQSQAAPRPIAPRGDRR